VLAGDLRLVAELLQLGPKLRVVGGADGGVVLPQLAVVEGLPDALGHPRHVGDDHMNMTLRIERTARVVLEQRIDEIAGPDRSTVLATLIASAFGKVLLHPRHGALHRPHVGGEDALVPGDVGHDAGRLGHGEGEVDP
jgi:hypothetical protein